MDCRISTTEENEALPLRRGVKALVSTGERVLLVKERHSNGRTFWTLPGGGVEAAESQLEALQRELHEELQCQVAVRGAVERVVYAHTSSDNTASLYTVFDCAILSEITANSAHGILDWQWARRDALPPRALPQVSLVVRSQYEEVTAQSKD